MANKAEEYWKEIHELDEVCRTCTIDPESNDYVERSVCLNCDTKWELDYLFDQIAKLEEVS